MIKKKLKIILNQKYPVRFIVSRLMRDLKIIDFVRITYKYRSIRLTLTRSALSLALWIDKNDRGEDSDLLARLLSPGGVFVDVGAHIGHLSLLASQIVGSSGRVYAFEAHPITYVDLIRNIDLNRADNIYPVNIAVGNCKRWVCFSDERRANDQNKVIKNGGLKVFCLTLDDILICDKVDLLKIDVEGFEKFVLLGAFEILKVVDFIIFEAYTKNYNAFGYKFSEIYNILVKFGFECVYIEGGYVRVLDESFDPVDCVNVVAYKNRQKFMEKTGFLVK